MIEVATETRASELSFHGRSPLFLAPSSLQPSQYDEAAILPVAPGPVADAMTVHPVPAQISAATGAQKRHDVDTDPLQPLGDRIARWPAEQQIEKRPRAEFVVQSPAQWSLDHAHDRPPIPEAVYHLGHGDGPPMSMASTGARPYPCDWRSDLPSVA